MRILHVVPSFFPATAYGGPLESGYRLCCHLAAQGHDVRVLTTDADGRDRVLRLPAQQPVTLCAGLRVYYSRRIGRHAAAPGLLRLLPGLVRWADAVHLTGVYSFPTLPTLMSCRLLCKPLVWSPRGSLQRWTGTTRTRAKDIWEAACRAVMPDTVRLHVTSEEEERASSQRFRNVAISVIPNGVAIPQQVSHVPDNAKLRLLFLGRLDPIKALEELVEACALLNDDDLPRPWHLTVAGDGAAGYRRQLERLVDARGLVHRISFVGHIGSEAKAELFAHADVLVLPSHSENFGLVVAEALAHAVPVVASRGTPWADVERIGCGRWVPNTPADLAAAIRDLAESDLRLRGLAGRAWIAEEFGWDAIAARMGALYSLTAQGAVTNP